MQGHPDSSATVEAPLGFLPARVEEKTGRLKLPAAITQSLAALGSERLFVTTFDRVSIRLYPLPLWREMEAMLSKPGEDAKVRAALRLRANHYGEDTEVDTSGRLVLPTTLRREMGLEGATVHLECTNGRIDLYGDEAYKARLAEADMLLAERPNVLAELGLL
jgi:DNA-binding transcriptional regulator/RsmH inhibitor MraZ